MFTSSRELFEHYSHAINQTRNDLPKLSRLHPDFITNGLNAISDKEARLAAPLLSELFPHLVASALKIPEAERRQLAAAWLSLYAYISLVDFELDRTGTLDGRTALSASALLGWGIATISRITSNSDFAMIFDRNVGAAFAGQYEDMQMRGDAGAERSLTDSNKNRAMIALVAGYSASAKLSDDRLIRASELLLGPFQLIDDLHDLAEDLSEGNFTTFVRLIGRNLSPEAHGSEWQLYRMLFSDPRVIPNIVKAAKEIRQCLLLLTFETDTHLVIYLGQLAAQLEQLADLTLQYQGNPRSANARILIEQVRQILCHS
jgi:hypothetical protein